MNDAWQWVAVLNSGARVAEADVSTLRAVPAPLVRELHLEHAGGGHVWVDMVTGEGWVNGIRVPRHPMHEGNRIPLFFRQRVSVGGKAPMTEFRAIGYMTLPGPLFAAIRVGDGVIDGKWATAWEPSTAAHTASQAMLIGG